MEQYASSKRTISEETLQEIVRRIVKTVAPEKIILFGSAARGEMGPDSDLDLLVVKSNVHRRATTQIIEESLIGIQIPTDIIVATPEDLERHKDTIGLIYRPALREGKIVYAS
jgi:predicted nucleotidyltransferase